MYYLIYTSDACNDFQENDLKDLLLHSRHNNSRMGITGMLYYYDGVFIQLLEGNEKDVLNIANTIKADARHQNFRILKEGNSDQRFFDNWDMGFKTLSVNDTEEIKYFNELNNAEVHDGSAIMKFFKILFQK